MHPYAIRPLDCDDQPFLWEIVYHALYVPEGGTPFPRAIVSDAGVAKYVREWGRPGDYGLIVMHELSTQPVGAAWLRLFPASDPGYGFIAEDIPEISIALFPGHRNLGLGTALLVRLIDHARTKYPALSLSVVNTNPAIHLYERLGFKAVAVQGNATTMICKLR